MFSLKNEKKWIIITLAFICLIFFALQIYSIFSLRDYFFLGSIEKMDNDDVKYIRSAWTLIDTGMFTYRYPEKATVYIMPGHTFIISFFVRLFGYISGITAFRVFQALIQVISLLLVFLIGRNIFDSKTGLIAVIIDAFYPPELQAAGIILTEVEFKFFVLLLVYISLIAIEKKSLKYYIAGGAVWGVSCLIRPTSAAYPVVILIIWILTNYIESEIKPYKIKEMFKFTVITSIVFFMIMSPWWIRNYITFNKFIPFTLSTGNPFIQGTYINYDQSKNHVEYNSTDDEIQTNLLEIKIGRERLKRYFKQEPIAYIYWYTIGKSLYMWNYPFYVKEVFGISEGAAALYHYIILALSILKMVGIIKKRKVKAYLIFFTLLYFDIIYLPYFTCSRYAYPVMPLVIIIAAYWVKNSISIIYDVLKKV